jgi:hypothetical protein
VGEGAGRVYVGLARDWLAGVIVGVGAMGEMAGIRVAVGAGLARQAETSNIKKMVSCSKRMQRFGLVANMLIRIIYDCHET